MNSEEVMNLLRQVLTLTGGLAAGAGYVSTSQASTISNDVMVAVPALVSLGSVLWSVYVHWNMKKVPETAVAK